MKFIFLIGNETPMDLLLLSLFLEGAPTGEVMVGVRRDTFSDWKGTIKIWNVFLKAGISFVGLNVLLNSGLGRTVMLNDNIAAPDVETLRKRHKFPLFYFDDVNGQQTLSEFRGFAPDVIFNHMPQRMRFPLISLPSIGIVNIHPGLLPEYQGMGSCLWPLIDEAPFQGSTLHYIDSEEFDTGPIIACGRFPIEKKDSVFCLHIKSRIIAAALAVYVANGFDRDGRLGSRPQGEGTYHKIPGKESLKLIQKYVSWSDRKIIKDHETIQFEYFDEGTGWEWRPWPYNNTL